jgi:hypothetical protein
MWKNGENRNPRWKKKMMQWRRNPFRVFYPHLRCFIYKHILADPRNSKAHKHLYKGVKILHIADDNNKGKKSVIERYEKTSHWARGLTNRRNQKEEEEVNLSL